MSPFEKLQEENKQKALEYTTRQAKAKALMHYAKMRISKLRYAIIEYESTGYWYTEQEPIHTFRIVEGCEKLTFDEAMKKIKELGGCQYKERLSG